MTAPVAAATRVMVAGDDRFELGYVVAVLRDHGHHVVGPFTDPADALQTIEAEEITAAILAYHGDPGARDCLSGALRGRDIRRLNLFRATTRTPGPDDAPMLTSPFGAFQVAEWVGAVRPEMPQPGLGDA